MDSAPPQYAAVAGDEKAPVPPAAAPYPGPPTYQPPGAYPPPGAAYPPPGAYPPPPQPAGAYPAQPGAYPGYAPQTTQPQTVSQQFQGYVQQGQGIIETSKHSANPAVERPPDNLVMALISCLCCNACCIGAIALYFAYQSQQDANANNMASAKERGEKARKLAIAAFIIGTICTILVIISKVLGG